MWGRKLQQLQQAMYSILDSLREDDYFSLIQFSTNVVVSCSVSWYTESIRKNFRNLFADNSCTCIVTMGGVWQPLRTILGDS
jgi:hypothetical protein